MSYPTVNKSLRFTVPGSALQVVEKEVTPVSANELLVKVHAASINPSDIQIWNSQLVGVVAGDKGIGRDFAGTVVAVGSSLKGWAEGDDVFGLLFHVFGDGTFSQYIKVNPASDPIAKNPGCFTHEQAASIPLVALTAFACLDWLPPSRGIPRKVIIQGASGGTGSWLIQVAKLVYDCHVTAICSTRNIGYVRSLGADEAIDYSTQSVLDTITSHRSTNGESDLFVDCVGGTELIPHYERFLRKDGAYVTIVGDKTTIKTLGGPVTYVNNPAQVLRYIKGWIWGPRYACVSLYTKSEYLEQLTRLGERGELKIELQEVVQGALDEEVQGWKRAVEVIEGQRARGKVVLGIP